MSITKVSRELIRDRDKTIYLVNRSQVTSNGVISSLDLDRTADNVGPEFFNFNFNLAGALFQDFQEYEAIISIFRASGTSSTMTLGTANSSAFDGRINISREL